MWQQIRANKRKSYILIVGMFLLFLFFGAIFGIMIWVKLFDSDTGMFFNSAYLGIAISMLIWFILLITALTNGKNTILYINQAYKLPEGVHKILENVVEEMTIAAGLPKKPEIYVLDSSMPNAFATGLTPENSAIAVTTGLLTELDRDELQGVIAHEIAHISNRDTMYMIFAGIMLGAIILISDFSMRLFGGSSHSRRSSRESSSGGGAAFLLLICLLFIILSWFLGRILYFSLSRRREYLADACAAQYTRYPQGLASALSKISSYECNENTNSITAAMYIVNPNQHSAGSNQKRTRSMYGELTDSHPPIEARIAVLMNMNGADYNSYNAAFLNISGRTRSILDKKELVNIKHIDIKKPDVSNVSGRILNPAGAAFVSAVISDESQFVSDEKNAQETKNTEKLERKRAAEDIVWLANDYIFKKCECGTKLKFPKYYKGQEISCPHCKRLIQVIDNN